jgi:MFS family permease
MLNQRSQLACAWATGISVVFLAIGFFLVSGYIPPPHADDTAKQLAHFYVSHRTRLRIGLVITLLAWSGYGPLTALISVQMLRIEGGKRPVLSILQALAGTAGWACLLIPTMLLLVATFRAGSVSPQTTQTLHDIGWITAFMAVPPFVVQLSAIAAAILKDHSPTPVFPRWLGYFNIWAAIAFVPGDLLIFFKSGPFSYQGLFVFWVPFVVFGAWILIMAWAAGRAALHDTESEPAPAPVAVPA